jgi:hypothetical protein
MVTRSVTTNWPRHFPHWHLPPQLGEKVLQHHHVHRALLAARFHLEGHDGALAVRRQVEFHIPALASKICVSDHTRDLSAENESPFAFGMVEYRKGAHTVFEIHLHLVWITKYRRPALHGEVATRVRDLIRDTPHPIPESKAMFFSRQFVATVKSWKLRHTVDRDLPA